MAHSKNVPSPIDTATEKGFETPFDKAVNSFVSSTGLKDKTGEELAENVIEGISNGISNGIQIGKKIFKERRGI